MKILEVELLTDNLEETEHFYSNQLGFRMSEKDTESITFVTGSSVLKFVRSFNIHPVYHFAFNIPCNLLKQALNFAKTRFRMIYLEDGELIADFDNWNAKAFYFYDNNGNILEFIARYDLENDSTDGFDTQAIESVSEIAVSTVSVNDLRNELETNHNIQPYHRQPPLPNFAALGDENGLIILSENGRHWFPTDVESRPFPLKIQVLEGGKRFSETFNAPANAS